MAKTLQKYLNGNCTVEIFDDGSKFRSYDGEPNPVFPDLVSLKITASCDGACPHCYAASEPTGRHCDVAFVKDLLQGLPAGVEIAIEGGNPFSHPQLEDLLRWMRAAGLVANITINAIHLSRYSEAIKRFRAESLIHGLGVSHREECRAAIHDIADNNTAVMFVLGVDKYLHYLALKPRKAVVLGFKDCGRGTCYKMSHTTRIQHDLATWEKGLFSYKGCGAVAFDALALEQLHVKSHMSDADWSAHYMGPAGAFSMHVDAVTRQFAVSESDPHMHFELAPSLVQAFETVRAAAKAYEVILSRRG